VASASRSRIDWRSQHFLIGFDRGERMEYGHELLAAPRAVRGRPQTIRPQTILQGNRCYDVCATIHYASDQFTDGGPLAAARITGGSTWPPFGAPPSSALLGVQR
jgi:hypothetical protein